MSLQLKTKNIAIYTRTGRNDGVEIENQIKYCKEFSEKQFPNCDLMFYWDINSPSSPSNKNLFEARKELERLLNDCKEGKINSIVVSHANRLSRNYEEFAYICTMAEIFNTNIYEAQKGTQLEGSTDESYVGLIKEAIKNVESRSSAEDNDTPIYEAELKESLENTIARYEIDTTKARLKHARLLSQRKK
jgi:DNA invertase Pin-like site-specific DNA recombinase